MEFSFLAIFLLAVQDACMNCGMHFWFLPRVCKKNAIASYLVLSDGIESLLRFPSFDCPETSRSPLLRLAWSLFWPIVRPLSFWDGLPEGHLIWEISLGW